MKTQIEEIEWHKISEELPPQFYKSYLISVEIEIRNSISRQVTCAYWTNVCDCCDSKVEHFAYASPYGARRIIAWAEMPKGWAKE